MRIKLIIIMVFGLICCRVFGAPKHKPAPKPTPQPVSAIASVSWSPAVGATSYIVKMGTSPGVYSKQVVALGNGATIAGLAPSGTYYFAVQAAAATNGPLSCEVAVTVPGTNSCTNVK